MAVSLVLQTQDDDRIVASLDGQVLAVTPLSLLPALERLQADPHHTGRALYAALGGNDLRARLDTDPERLLLLETDARADVLPWEFAALGDNQFLAAEYGMLRLVDRTAAANQAPADAPLQFVALAADPLVDAQGNARTGYRLDLENEMRAIRQVLQQSNVALQARRVPPTKEQLGRALCKGPAILHLTCHGDLMQTPDGPQALLVLEDQNGKEDQLLGRDLMVMPPAGVLRLVLLSACRSAEGTEAQLARALVQNGVPFAIGMQGLFNDKLSDDIAVALYESVLAGLTLAESLRQMRHALLANGDMFGLPVGYTAREGWGALPIAEGRPAVGWLGLPGQVSVNSQVQPPRPLLGRNGELYELARLYANGHKVVTVNGTGGMGKTALAATFVERFAWRWADGVRVVSYANETVDARTFRVELVRLLQGEQAAREIADASAEQQANVILQTLRDWDGLLVLDNYETILQGTYEHDVEAEKVHWLVGQMANGGDGCCSPAVSNPRAWQAKCCFPRRMSR
ncbi:MAG: CHAT domain-containing protein [Chloroflexi bacterium]|nr:CHAT domain-containing protein [Chloroflexota bacterium]